MYHFHNHINGAPEELSNHTGQIIWRARYRTWGNTVLMEWEKENYTHEEKVRHYPKTQNLRFQGQYFDEETGLHYNTFRYYDPDIGRFISQDPIGLAGGLNLYQYAPNPISWIDPWGWIAEAYKLIAAKNGFYDLVGFKKPTIKGGAYLRKGEVYKFGETTLFNKAGVQQRYSNKWLMNNNLDYKALQHSPNKSAKKSFQKYETNKIDKYTKQRGKKPPGNRCRH